MQTTQKLVGGRRVGNAKFNGGRGQRTVQKVLGGGQRTSQKPGWGGETDREKVLGAGGNNGARKIPFLQGHKWGEISTK